MTVTDFTETPVFIHEVYNRETGAVYYLRHSYDSTPDKAYLELADWAGLIRKKHSEWIRSAQPGKEMKERLETPMPEELDWAFIIEKILPQNSYSNNGGRRKKALQKRLSIKAPLFAEELYDRALEEDKGYLTGDAECDQVKAVARETYTDEYWDARFWADLEVRRAL